MNMKKSEFWQQCNSVTPEESNTFVSIWCREFDAVRVIFSQFCLSEDELNHLFALLVILLELDKEDRDKAIKLCSSMLMSSRNLLPSMKPLLDDLNSVQS